MTTVEAKIHHLYHSGFAVETSNHFLIFDYYLDKIGLYKEKSIRNGLITSELLKGKKSVLVFVTHSHGDHFNPIIFSWQEANPNIKYIISSDVEAPINVNSLYSMEVGKSFMLKDDIHIKTYGTTDKGVSFMVTLDDLNIYHAGDLNWWHWKNFTKDQQLKEEEDFKTEVNKITESIDIAFVPVDPRLEEFFYLGGEYFAHRLQPKLLIPMHFADNYQTSIEFAIRMKDSPVTTAIIEGRGQVINFEKSI